MARVDFHVHTPASSDFLGGGTTVEVLRSARDRGTDVVVLTDHNSLDGYLDVVDQVSSLAPMLVLPGVEVTCRGGASGIHVLGVFNPSRLGRRPRWILKGLGLDPSQRHGDGISSLDVVDVCAAIHRRGGLAIAAHAASNKGVLSEMRGQQLPAALTLCAFDGFELGTSAQRRSGADVLGRLDMISSVAVVQGSDSHRSRPAPTLERPHGPGERSTVLTLAKPWTFEQVRAALANSVGRFDPEPVNQPAIDVFREGRDPSVFAVWRAFERKAITRAVAATASHGHGTVLVGVRRGGRGGRGLIIARNVPSASEIEQWIWSDVSPTPAVQVDRQADRDRAYIEISVLQDLNPFIYGVDGVPLHRRSGKVRRMRVVTADHADMLTALRRSVSADVLERLGDERPSAVSADELESLFPWRGYLTHAERSHALRKLAHRISKGSGSGTLRAWAIQESAAFKLAAGEEVSTLTRSFTISQARLGLRQRLDDIGASRPLRRRVMSALDGALGPSDPIGLADEAYDSSVLQLACERLADTLEDQMFESELRDIAVDEGRRTSELIGSLVTDHQIRVIVGAVSGELGSGFCQISGHRDQLGEALSRPPILGRLHLCDQ